MSNLHLKRHFSFACQFLTCEWRRFLPTKEIYLFGIRRKNERKKMNILKIATVILVISSSINCYAWDGFDYDSSTFIEIEKGNLVREGSDIEFYDYSDGYKTGTVDSITKIGSRLEIEITEDQTGSSRTFEMD